MCQQQIYVLWSSLYNLIRMCGGLTLNARACVCVFVCVCVYNWTKLHPVPLEMATSDMGLIG
jgi:hypothetical protein